MDSTKKVYHKVWTYFNKFLIRLDEMPKTWEYKLTLFCTFLIMEEGLQSSTVRSYISAIKKTLATDGYYMKDRLVLLNTITKSCKLKYDRLKVRLPIGKNLLEMLITQVKKSFKHQEYVQRLYSAVFCICYYGLLRVGEVAESIHSLKAVNIHKSDAKNRLLIILYSSKTHGLRNKPQQIRIFGNTKIEIESDEGCVSFIDELINSKTRFCPVQIIKNYIDMRPAISDMDEHFFIFHDKSNLKPFQLRSTLRRLLQELRLDDSKYDTHSFRIGRAMDLEKYNIPIDQIKSLGRWKSNAVYKYLKNS